MDVKAEVLYIPTLALLYGKTEASIRSGLQAGASWLPPSFKIAGQHAWLLEDVRQFLREYRDGEHQPAKRGRPRKTPPTLLSIQRIKKQ